MRGISGVLDVDRVLQLITDRVSGASAELLNRLPRIRCQTPAGRQDQMPTSQPLPNQMLGTRVSQMLVVCRASLACSRRRAG